jgi:hypothetical protein
VSHVASLGERRFPIGALALGTLGVAVAIAFGFAAGYGTTAALIPAGMLVGVAILVGAVFRPFLGFRVMAASLILLACWVLPSGKGINALDLLLLPVLAVSVLGGVRREAVLADAAALDGSGRDIVIATRRLTRSVILYFAIIVASLLTMLIQGRGQDAIPGSLIVVRECQGMMLFPLALWWLRDERRIRAAIVATLAGGGVFAIVNIVGKGLGGVKRMGLGWYVNQPEWPIDYPSDGALAMLLLIVLLLARQKLRQQKRNLVMIAVALAMIVLTFSRSGLIALLTFTLLCLPRARARWVVGGALALAALLPLVPAGWWERMARTITHEKGSYETYTTLIRVLAWKTAIPMFLDHPIFGVGFMGFSSFSSAYNDLRIVLHPVENYYLEMATSLGLIGLAGLTLVVIRLFQLGRAVGRHAPPGTVADALARYHAPLIIALLVANLAGDIFIGMVALGQLALWSALLIRAGHAAVGPSPARAGA